VWYVILGVIVLILVIIFIIRRRSANIVHENPLEKYLNQEAIVTEPISDTLGTGKIKIDGQEIQAKRNGPGVIGIGTKVEIVDVDTSLCVVKVKGENS